MYFSNPNAEPKAEDTYFDFNESTDLSYNEDEYDDDGARGVVNEDAALEAMIVDQYERLDEDTRRALMNDEEFKTLVEAGVVGRRSLVRLNRADDLSRRMTILSLQMAKETNSPDFVMYKKFRKREKECLAKIRKRFAPRVRRQARDSQKRLIKLNPKAFKLNIPIR